MDRIQSGGVMQCEEGVHQSRALWAGASGALLALGLLAELSQQFSSQEVGQSREGTGVTWGVGQISRLASRRWLGLHSIPLVIQTARCAVSP